MNERKQTVVGRAAQLRRRVQHLVTARLRPRDRMAEAVRVQDAIRRRKRKNGAWDSVSAIRAARDGR